MRWLGLVVATGQVVLVGWMWREIYRNYGQYGRADHGNRPRVAAVLIVFLITAQQTISVIKDPTRTTDWVLLGFGIACSLVAVIGFLRARDQRQRT